MRPVSSFAEIVEDLLDQRWLDISHESVRIWVDRFGRICASKIRTCNASYMRQHTQWQSHLDKVLTATLSAVI